LTSSEKNVPLKQTGHSDQICMIAHNLATGCLCFSAGDPWLCEPAFQRGYL